MDCASPGYKGEKERRSRKSPCVHKYRTGAEGPVDGWMVGVAGEPPPFSLVMKAESASALMRASILI